MSGVVGHAAGSSTVVGLGSSTGGVCVAAAHVDTIVDWGFDGDFLFQNHASSMDIDGFSVNPTFLFIDGRVMFTILSSCAVSLRLQLYLVGWQPVTIYCEAFNCMDCEQGLNQCGKSEYFCTEAMLGQFCPCSEIHDSYFSWLYMPLNCCFKANSDWPFIWLGVLGSRQRKFYIVTF